MTSRRVWIVFCVGLALLVIVISIALLGLLVPQLPEVIRKSFLDIHKMLYWLIPLIMLLFLSPMVLDYSRRPDIDMIFQIEDGGNLKVVVVNKGDVPFSFNRVQFYVKRTKLVTTLDGKINLLHFTKSGEEETFQMREDAGCVVLRGVPIIFWANKEVMQSDFRSIISKAPDKPIYCKLYFEGTRIFFKSKKHIPDDYVASCKIEHNSQS